jgi:hypothetical protein
MKKIKYLSIFVLLFGALAFACSDESMNPLQSEGDDEEDIPIIITSPTEPEDSTSIDH